MAKQMDKEYATRILNLNNNYSVEELKKAHRDQSKKYHPDVNHTDPNAERKMQLVNAAYAYLKKSGNSNFVNDTYKNNTTADNNTYKKPNNSNGNSSGSSYGNYGSEYANNYGSGFASGYYGSFSSKNYSSSNAKRSTGSNFSSSSHFSGDRYSGLSEIEEKRKEANQKISKIFSSQLITIIHPCSTTQSYQSACENLKERANVAKNKMRWASEYDISRIIDSFESDIVDIKKSFIEKLYNDFISSTTFPFTKKSIIQDDVINSNYDYSKGFEILYDQFIERK